MSLLGPEADYLNEHHEFEIILTDSEKGSNSYLFEIEVIGKYWDQTNDQ